MNSLYASAPAAAAAARLRARETGRRGCAGARARHALRRLLADDDRHVREPLAFEICASLCPRIEALREAASRAAVDGDARDVELVHVHVVVRAGVRHRAAHEAFDRIRGVDAGKFEQHERLAHALAANRVGDAAELARPHANEAQVRDGLRHGSRNALRHGVGPVAGFTADFSPP